MTVRIVAVTGNLREGRVVLRRRRARSPHRQAAHHKGESQNAAEQDRRD
ncbi:hypothetical protein [Wenzhouxiangella sp. XN201]|nr:hypothetical protein [Wenzhouxiangella sp. XN201]